MVSFDLKKLDSWVQTSRRVIPSWCYQCHKHLASPHDTESQFLCDECGNLLPRVRTFFCGKCGGPHPSEDCRTVWAKHIDRFYAIFHYEEPVLQWIASLKYGRNVLSGRVLRHFVMRWFETNQGSLSHIDLLIPVPMHSGRLFQRGFNQASFLLASQRQFRISSDVIKKNKMTRQQAGLSGKERAKNLKGSFSVRKSIKDKNVLLFDDVKTTGHTLAEVSRTLKKAGAGSVSAVCLSIRQ